MTIQEYMQIMVQFWQQIGTSVTTFLLSPPIAYFVGLFILFTTAGLIKYMIRR